MTMVLETMWSYLMTRCWLMLSSKPQDLTSSCFLSLFSRSISSRCSGAMAARRSSTDATASSLTCRWVCWRFPGGTPWILEPWARSLSNTNGANASYVRGSPETSYPCDAGNYIMWEEPGICPSSINTGRRWPQSPPQKCLNHFWASRRKSVLHKGRITWASPFSLAPLKVTDPDVSGLR